MTVATRSVLLGSLVMILASPMGVMTQAAEVLPPQVYELTTETGMPHLEENLRYTTHHERVCLTHQALSAVFPVLEHPALRGCRLQDEVRRTDAIYYTLVCSGGHGTTGQAVWHTGPRSYRGTLNIRLGGKNMTFYQRITAIPVGACASGP